MTQPTILGLLQRSPAIGDFFASQKEAFNQRLSRAMSRNAYLEAETLIRNMSGSLMRHYQTQAESFSIPAFLSSAILEGDSFESAIQMISFLRDKGFK